jgi:hypothetical protein
MDKTGNRLETARATEGDTALALSGFSRVQGRQAPKVMTVTGKGFSVAIEFTNVKMEFAPAVLPTK